MKTPDKSVLILILGLAVCHGDLCLAETPFTVDLDMPDQSLVPNDLCLLVITEYNGYAETNIVYWRLVVLEVFGYYYFWPRWEQTMDYLELYLKHQKLTYSTILSFQWPYGAGTANGLAFWGAAFVKGDSRIGPTEAQLLDYDYLTFNFAEPPTATPDPGKTATPTPIFSPTHTPTPDHIEYRFTIQGTSAEVDTGLTLKTGDMVSITAWGQICFYSTICEQTLVGPYGYEVACYDEECNHQPYNPPYNHAALLGRLSNQSSYFLIGEKSVFIAPSDARLILALNDGDVANNDGFFQGIVFIYPE